MKSFQSVLQENSSLPTLHVYLSIHFSERLHKENLQVSKFLNVFKQALSTSILKSKHVDEWVIRYVKLDPILAEQSLSQKVPYEFKKKFNMAIQKKRQLI
jgi:hypothetical protein